MTNDIEKLEIIKKHVKSYVDFPVKGVVFRDIFSILKEPKMFEMLRDVLFNYVKSLSVQPTCVAALDSRGFLFGTLLALEFQIPFVAIRKKHKLPGPIVSVTYSLEYGQDVFEMQEGCVNNNDKVLIIDDLLATGGSLEAACQLIEKLGGFVLECLVIMELVDLKGAKRVSSKVHSFLKY